MTAPCTLPVSSLQIGPFDLFSDDSAVTVAQGWDRGAAQPTLSSVQASVLDGAAVLGLGAGNRSPSLPVTVKGADRVDLAKQANTFIACVTAQTWQMTFTPGGGYPVVFDCYKATVTVTSGIRQEQVGLAQSLTITFSALPYGKSQAAVTASLAGSPVLLDALDSGAVPTVTASTGTIGTPAYVTSPAPYQGSKSLAVPFTPSSSIAGDIRRYVINMTITRTGLSTTLTADMATVKLALRTDGTVTGHWYVYVTVETSDGTTYAPAPQYIDIPTTAWLQGSFAWDVPDIPAGATVTGYTVNLAAFRVSTWTGSPTTVYLDDVQLFPATTSGVADGQGAVVGLNGVQGTARAPIALALSQVAAGSFKSWLVHSPPPDRPRADPLVPLGGASAPFGPGSTFGAQVYDGVYDIWLVASSVKSPGTPRTWSVAFNELVGGRAPSTPPQTISAVVSPQPNQLVYIGSVALPGVAHPPDADPHATTTFYFTSSATGGGTTDSFADMLLLDTRGQTILVDSTAPSQPNVWVDEPDPTVALGGVYSGTATDRSDALAVGASLIRAGVLFANPGDSSLLLYSPEGALQGQVTYYPRWQLDATG